MDRAEQLRNRCLDRKKANACFNRQELYVLAGKSLVENNGLAGLVATKHGIIVRDILMNLPFEIDELELLAGRLAAGETASGAQRQKYIQATESHCWGQGQTGHAEINYRLILENGIVGIRDIINKKIAVLDETQAEDYRKRTFYESCLLALEGFEKLAENCRAAVQRALDRETKADRQAELKELLAVLERVPMKPARSFYEAIQSLTMTSLACEMGERISYVVAGRIDRSLRKYYEADIKSGKITRDKTLALIECLYVVVNENTPDGGATSIMVGGKNDSDIDMTNDLSYLCLEALRRTRLVYPTVGICWNEQTPDDLMDLACDLIKDGITTPAFFGDDTIAKGMMNYGLDKTQSYNYINSTCVEITPVGCSNVYVASPYFNLCQMLLDEINADQTNDYESFIAGYKKRVADEIKKQVGDQNRCRLTRMHYGGKPFQSIFTNSCLERGLDIDLGGADCNWIECSFVGLANLVDCLYVVKQEVFQQKNMSLGELWQLLQNDYEGADNVRHRFLNYPKYGNAKPEVDSMVSDVTKFLRNECDKYTVCLDSRFIPGFFCWQMHEVLGRQTCATPDGRCAGFPFADGSGPAQGRERSGPTGAVLSSVSWEHWPMIGGLVLNLKFPKNVFRSEADVIKLRDLVKSYLTMGGFEAQINVVDNATLRKAQQQPELYSDMVVRVAGYTDYFTRMSSQMQEEVIARSELSL